VSTSARIRVKVVPGASRTRVAGRLGDAWKIAVAKPPAGGQANAAVIELLAGLLGVSRSAVVIAAGHTNPRKTIDITGLDPEQVETLLKPDRAQ
jgi:uncharacterized protein